MGNKTATSIGERPVETVEVEKVFETENKVDPVEPEANEDKANENKANENEANENEANENEVEATNAEEDQLDQYRMGDTTSSLPIFTVGKSKIELTNKAQTLPTPNLSKINEIQRKKLTQHNISTKAITKYATPRSFVSKIDNSPPASMITHNQSHNTDGTLIKFYGTQGSFSTQQPKDKESNLYKTKNKTTKAESNSEANGDTSHSITATRSYKVSKFVPSVNIGVKRKNSEKLSEERFNIGESTLFPSNTSSTAVSNGSYKLRPISVSSFKTNTPNIAFPGRAQTPGKHVFSTSSSTTKINNVPSFISTRSRSPYYPLPKDYNTNQHKPIYSKNSFGKKSPNESNNDYLNKVEKISEKKNTQKFETSLPELGASSPKSILTPSNSNNEEQSLNRSKNNKKKPDVGNTRKQYTGTDIKASKENMAKPSNSIQGVIPPTTKKVNRNYTRSYHTQKYHMKNVFRTSIHDSIHSPLTRIY